MASRHARAIEKNIEQDATGITVVIPMKGLKPRRKRFALDVWYTPDGKANEPGRARVRQWREDTRSAMAEELRHFGTPSAASMTRGTLETDFAAWRGQVLVREGAGSDKSHGNAWLNVVLPDVPGLPVVSKLPLGQWQTADLTPQILNRVIVFWQTAPSPGAILKVKVKTFARVRNVEGLPELRSRNRARGNSPVVREYVRAMPATSGTVVSNTTIRHRCRVFTAMWNKTQGDAPCPMDHKSVTIPKRAATDPTPIPDAILDATLRKLAGVDLATFARYAIAVTCWTRPVALMRAQPDDVQLDAPQPYWSTRNQKGAPGRLIYLGPAAVAAWSLFVSLNLWGTFKTTYYGNQIHKAGLPSTTRPYNARHSGATNAAIQGISIEKIAGQLGNDPRVAAKFYARYVPDPAREIATKTGDRFLDVFKPRLVATK